MSNQVGNVVPDCYGGGEFKNYVKNALFKVEYTLFFILKLAQRFFSKNHQWGRERVYRIVVKLLDFEFFPNWSIHLGLLIYQKLRWLFFCSFQNSCSKWATLLENRGHFFSCGIQDYIYHNAYWKWVLMFFHEEIISLQKESYFCIVHMYIYISQSFNQVCIAFQKVKDRKLSS